jgi:acyl carrier protein
MSAHAYSPFELEIATLMVSTLSLELAPTDIAPEAPLFGDGLGLDSIDALELALEFEQRYGVEIRADDENNVRIFASLRSLTNHIDQNRRK